MYGQTQTYFQYTHINHKDRQLYVAAFKELIDDAVRENRDNPERAKETQ